MLDLSPLTPSLKLLLVHAAYGRAMMKAHRLEMRLSVILMCHAVENKCMLTPEQIKRMTFGTLTKHFVQELRPSEYLEDELDNMLYFRNELTHRISETIVGAARHEEWHEKIITELGEIESYFVETDELLSPYFERCYEITKTSEEILMNVVRSAYPGIRVAANNSFSRRRKAARLNSSSGSSGRAH